MTVLMILLSIVAIFWMLSLIRLGIRVVYGEDGLRVSLLVGPAKFYVLPMREKKHGRHEMKKREKEHVEQRVSVEKVGQHQVLVRILELMPTVLEAAGALRRKICINDVHLTLIWGGTDPASTAIGYGRANAVLGMIWPLVEHNFKVKHCQIHTGIDYERTHPQVDGWAKVTITVGQIIALGCWYGLKILKLWIRSGRAADKQQEA